MGRHTAVELVGVGVLGGLLLGGVGNGVLQTAGLAILASQGHVQVVDHEGRAGNGQDVTNV